MLAEQLRMTISPAVPAVLLAILGASGVMFWMLVRRWTQQQHWLALSDWAEANQFVLSGQDRAVRPGLLLRLGTAGREPRVLLSLHDADTTIVQVEALPQATQHDPAVLAPPARWNLLIRRLETTWPTTGLRPQGHAHSVLDFFKLADMQAMSPSERFVLYGQEAGAAKALAGSLVRGLLPPDIALLLVGNDLVLDFSTRPMDPLTLARMDALAEQIVSHLPIWGKPG